MEGYLLSQQRRELLGVLGVHRVHGVEILTSGPLSHVERLHLPAGETVIYKTSLEPFTDEEKTLRSLHAQGLPVPRVRKAEVVDGMLGMLLHDLGAPGRKPELVDAAHAAVQLHRVQLPAARPVLDQETLAAMPAEALEFFDRIWADGRYRTAMHLRDLLLDLTGLAAKRAEGAELEPFGFVHGRLQPSTLQIGARGHWHVLDFTKSLTGPGLLDLAAWSGVRTAPDLTRTRQLLELYVQAGGHADALAERGGLPAEAWALGWLRLQAAHWLLGRATTEINDPVADTHHLTTLHCQLAGAHALLDP